MNIYGSFHGLSHAQLQKDQYYSNQLPNRTNNESTPILNASINNRNMPVSNFSISLTNDTIELTKLPPTAIVKPGNQTSKITGPATVQEFDAFNLSVLQNTTSK